VGLIWDMIQHGQINRTRERAESLKARVDQLEDELRRTNETLMSLLRTLEQRFGDDLDGDGQIG
jgi:chaperonin cofactor prefoldin